MTSGLNCLRFGQQNNCLENEHLDCDLFGLCELITYQKEKDEEG